MTTQKFFTSRVHTSSTVFVGDKGRMFYDEVTGFLRLSDGRTPGGSLIYFPISVATSSTIGGVRPDGTTIVINTTTGVITAPYTYTLPTATSSTIGGVRPDGTTIVINTTTGVITAPYTYTLPTATSSTIGGVRLGPGVTTNGSNQIIIDSTGLDFSFGDIASTIETYTDLSDYAVLQTINLNEDLILASNGTGGIHIVGEFRVHATDGSLTAILESIPAFEIKADGQVKMLVPVIDSVAGAVAIVGSATGEFISPVNTGVMLHITGNYAVPAVPSRIYNDSQNTFGAFVARRFNGTVASPTAVLADEEIMRISGTSHNGTSIPGTGQARIIYKALGNQTLTNQGGYIELWATPLNSTTIAKIATINNADGITSTKFTGPLTGNVTGKADTAGNADTVTNGVYTNGSYANPAWITSLAASKVGLGSVENTALSTSTHYIGTTSITYNRASASQSLTGVSIDGAAGSVAAANITGTTLAATVVTSSLTSVGTLTSLAVVDSITDSIGNLRSIPINGKSAAYILAATDNGQMISITTGGVTVNSGVFASPYGQTVSIYNNSASSQTITQGAGVTLRLAGTTATGNRTLARYGVATIVCVAANTFVMSGAGVS